MTFNRRVMVCRPGVHAGGDDQASNPGTTTFVFFRTQDARSMAHQVLHWQEMARIKTDDPQRYRKLAPPAVLDVLSAYWGGFAFDPATVDVLPDSALCARWRAWRDAARSSTLQRCALAGLPETAGGALEAMPLVQTGVDARAIGAWHNIYDWCDDDDVDVVSYGSLPHALQRGLEELFSHMHGGGGPVAPHGIYTPVRMGKASKRTVAVMALQDPCDVYVIAPLMPRHGVRGYTGGECVILRCAVGNSRVRTKAVNKLYRLLKGRKAWTTTRPNINATFYVMVGDRQVPVSTGITSYCSEAERRRHPQEGGACTSGSSPSITCASDTAAAPPKAADPVRSAPTTSKSSRRRATKVHVRPAKRARPHSPVEDAREDVPNPADGCGAATTASQWDDWILDIPSD